MNVIIEKIELTNFKGCRNATYEFGEKSNSILGQNGAGKSTIATAWYWAFANCDSDLHNNPAIFPLDEEECVPTVRIWLKCDGKSVEVAKMQKRTIKKSNTGGADTISLSNSYEVNSVEYGERDFTKKLKEEYGFDLNLFLPLSHPDVFTSKKADEMRKILFSMASSKTDLEIAEQTENAVEVAELLKNYTVEEIKAMQTATLRKIKEEYGKDGEILKATIRGLEQAKVDIDVAELELQRNALKEQIAENKAKQEDNSKILEEHDKASNGILELKFELNDLQRKANEENNKKRLQIQNELDKKNSDYDMYEAYESGTRSRIKSDTEKELPLLEQRLIEKQELWKSVNAEQIDENKYVCPTCHRELPEEEKENILSNFEEMKKQRLEFIVAEGEKASQAVKDKKKYIEDSKKEAEEYEKKQDEILKQIEELEQQLSELPESIDISDRPEAQEIQRQIAEKEQAMNKGNGADEIRQQLKAEGEDLQSQLTEVEKQLALAQKNIEIDEQIADLRKKQGEYEQNKADCEKILYQLDLVNRKKNTLLQDDINSHFELVDFKLFDWLKNGEYKETCIPTYRNKDMGISTNTGLEMLMKLDIIRGLQSFYNMHLPVFVDGAEALSESTTKMINMDCQLILLKVSEDKKLKVEVM